MIDTEKLRLIDALNAFRSGKEYFDEVGNNIAHRLQGLKPGSIEVKNTIRALRICIEELESIADILE